ncbi:MAG: PE-PPE domain-containing protein [Mycobacterium sp.]|nr:PE-PPE domain-containing protein [Mycobacterium sp.]
MSFLVVSPDAVAAAAPHLESIGATISDANAAAAASTTQLLPAAEDEISAVIAGLFGNYAQDFHALAAQAAGFHNRFVQAVSASARSYVAAESTGAAALSQAGAGAPVAAQQVVVDAAGGIPENAYPFGGVKQLTFTGSVNEGLQILDDAIHQQLGQGNTVNVYGYSQGAVVASLEMAKLQAAGVPGGPNSPVTFTIVGDPMNPNGGFYERFVGLQLPSLGMNFYGATPATPYPANIYTIEYDGYADFPRYPLNFLADMNALASENHFYYHVLSQQQLNTLAIQLPTSGPTTTNYYMIPANNLPLLGPIRSIPFLGNPLADLLQPDMTYLVNMGYGDPRYGWSTGPANVPTPAGLFPPVSSFEMLPGLLASGAQQGFHDFVGDLMGTGPNPITLPTVSSLTSLLQNPTSLLSTLYPSAAATSAATPSISSIGSLLTGLPKLLSDPAAIEAALLHIPTALSQVVAYPYTVLLPTADILNAALISIPNYDITLFLDGISQAVNGQPVAGLMSAFGQPIASDVALYLYLTSVESAAITNPTEAAGPTSGFAGING